MTPEIFPALTEDEVRQSRFEQACRTADQMRRQTWAMRNAEYVFGIRGIATAYFHQDEMIFAISRQDLR